MLSVHLVLSDRSRGLVDAQALDWMKPTALLVNTARGPIVDEAALIKALQKNRLAGAALDVFEVEPLPEHHPFRTLENVLATPHVGYVSRAELPDVLFADDRRYSGVVGGETDSGSHLRPSQLLRWQASSYRVREPCRSWLASEGAIKHTHPAEPNAPQQCNHHLPPAHFCDSPVPF